MAMQQAGTFDEQVFWPSSTSVPKLDNAHKEFVNELMCVVLPPSLKGLTTSDRGTYRRACRWLIYGLYQSFYALPRAPLGLPMASSAYGKQNPYEMPFGQRIIVNVIKAATCLGFVQIEKGTYNPTGKGRITRVYPAGRLLAHFLNVGFVWVQMTPPPKSDLVLLNKAKGGKQRSFVDRRKSKEVAVMQDNLEKINTFLSEQCIWIDLADTKIISGVMSGQRSKQLDDKLLNGGSALNMQQVFLRRIFAQNSLTLGGRFYGGWWQTIPKTLRPRIMINDFQTVEFDYSGLAFNMLYAEKNLVPPVDPYEIGLNFQTSRDRRRQLVKKYMNAALNDDSGKFRLSASELSFIGLSHHELKKRTLEKHSQVGAAFGSGVGVSLQYLDSQMAEQVMLRMLDSGEVCLPIHDSFIVRTLAIKQLDHIMKDVYQMMFGQTINVKPTINFSGNRISNPEPSLLKKVSDMASIQTLMQQHLERYSIVRGFKKSWESQMFTEKQIKAKIHSYNRMLPSDKLSAIHVRHMLNGLPRFCERL